MQQVDSILATIEIDTDIIEALVTDSRALDSESASETAVERCRIERALSDLDAKASRLLDGYLEGVVPVEAYRSKADGLAQQRRSFERAISALPDGAVAKTQQVERLARQAGTARLRLSKADTEGKPGFFQRCF